MKLPIVLISALLFTPVSLASDTVWAEREALVRLQQHLEALESAITQAEANSDQQRRLKFNYSALRRDVGLIHQKIGIYLHQPMEPSSVQPVDGEVSQYGSYR